MNAELIADRLILKAANQLAQTMHPRFLNVFCSQCGQDFGPGEHGFSHCRNHAGKPIVRVWGKA